MALKDGLIAELKHESANTRKMLERIPADKYTWKPHEKSMELLKLAAHIARTPIWVGRSLNATEFDFAKNPQTPAAPLKSVDELLALHDSSIAEAVKILETTPDEAYMKSWTLRNGEKIYFTMPAIAVVRNFALSHITHHRGQLSVYLRLLDIPVPGMYGPSADETM
jgi:uncharacterized damage-inducible protein DinB